MLVHKTKDDKDYPYMLACNIYEIEEIYDLLDSTDNSLLTPTLRHWRCHLKQVIEERPVDKPAMDKELFNKFVDVLQRVEFCIRRDSGSEISQDNIKRVYEEVLQVLDLAGKPHAMGAIMNINKNENKQ